VFDELLRVQLALVQRKRRLEAESRGIAHDVTGSPGSIDSSPSCPSRSPEPSGG
jgi:hypothetical protein